MSEMRVDIIEGYDSDLAKKLNELILLGFAIRFMLPNGVNRWTIVSEKRMAITIGPGAARVLHGTEVVVKKPAQEGETEKTP